MTTPFVHYKLSKELIGHTKDVRSVCALKDGRVVTGSRDHSIRVWDVYKPQQSQQEVDNIVLHGHSNFVGALTSLSPNNVHQRVFASGSNDKTVCVWDKNSISKTDPTKNPVLTLIGHNESISCLSFTHDNLIISGSWDKTIKIWSDTAECLSTLTKHEHAVWAVLGLPNDDIVSASADKKIIIWRQQSKSEDGKSLVYAPYKVLDKHKDCVRGLVLVADLGMFASCSNDGLIAVWTLDGECVQEFNGHQSIVYGVGHVPGVGFVSCSEDRSVKVWTDGECVQTIAHPTCVWSIAVAINGDLITGCADGVARVWTRNEGRVANASVIELYHQQLAQQQIQSDNIGDIKMSDLKDTAALIEPGKKDGEVKVVNEAGKAMAFQWSVADNEWIKIGEVVDSSKSSAPKGKSELEGVQYDYVFDIDVNEGTMYRIGYNLGENPYEIAQQFIWKHELNQAWLEEIAQFLVKNTDQTMTLGNTAYSDPFTGANRYVPGSAPPTAPTNQTPELVILPNQNIPQGVFVYFEQANNAEVLANKLKEFNALVKHDTPTLALDLDDGDDTLNQFKAIFATLKETSRYHSSSFSDAQYRVITKMLKWPAGEKGQLIPVLDTLRTMVLHPSASKKLESMLTMNQFNLIESLLSHSKQLLTFSNPSTDTSQLIITTQILIQKIFCNMVKFDLRKHLQSSLVKILEHFSTVYQSISNIDKNYSICYSTLLLDYSVLISNNKEALNNSQQQQSELVAKIVSSLELAITRELASDGDVLLRLMIALGTILFVYRDVAKKCIKDRSIIISIFSSNTDPKIRENFDLLSKLV